MWIHLTKLHICFLKQYINTLFEEQEKGFLDRIESYADKGYIISSKRERSLLRNFFLICEFMSQSYNLDIREQFAYPFSWNLQTDILEPVVAHGEKGNILR